MPMPVPGRGRSSVEPGYVRLPPYSARSKVQHRAAEYATYPPPLQQSHLVKCSTSTHIDVDDRITLCSPRSGPSHMDLRRDGE